MEDEDGNKVVGEALIGTVLTPAGLNPSKATVKYQWQRSEDGETWADFGEATTEAEPYTLDVADAGDFIRLKATGTGSYRSTVYSKAVGPVLAATIEMVDPEEVNGDDAAEGWTRFAGTVKVVDAIETGDINALYLFEITAGELAEVDEGDVALQYWDGSNWGNFGVIEEDGKIYYYFGPRTGFDLSEVDSAETQFQVKIKTDGDSKSISGKAYLIIADNLDKVISNVVDTTVYDAGVVDAALNAINGLSGTADEIETLKEHADVLGLNLGEFNMIFKGDDTSQPGGRQTAVMIDLAVNKPAGDYTLDNVKAIFDSIVAVRLACQESMDMINEVTAEDFKDIDYVRILATAFGNADANHKYHGSKSTTIASKVAEMQQLVNGFDALGEDTKTVVLEKVVEARGQEVSGVSSGGKFLRASATTDALRTALDDYVATVKNKDELSTALGNNAKVIIVDGTIDNADTIVINRSVTLKAVNEATIKGCIDIKADDVTIDGLKITGAENSATTPTIKVSNQSGIKLTNNEITGNGNGIYVTKVSENGTIEITNNEITVGMTGIAIGSCENEATVTITGNTLKGNGKHGLSLGKVENYELTITGNTFEGNKTSHYSDRNLASKAGEEVLEKITQFVNSNNIVSDWQLVWSTDGSGIYNDRVLLVSGEANVDENGDENNNGETTEPGENNGNGDGNSNGEDG